MGGGERFNEAAVDHGGKPASQGGLAGGSPASTRPPLITAESTRSARRVARSASPRFNEAAVDHGGKQGQVGAAGTLDRASTRPPLITAESAYMARKFIPQEESFNEAAVDHGGKLPTGSEEWVIRDYTSTRPPLITAESQSYREGGPARGATSTRPPLITAESWLCRGAIASSQDSLQRGRR